MPSRFEELYRVRKIDGRGEPLTPEFFDRRLRDIDLRLAGLEDLRIAWQEALVVVQDRVLSRTEEVIAGLRDKLISITELDWLVAHSDTPRTLTVGATFALQIVEADAELFAPGPFAFLSRAANAVDGAVVKTLNYDRALRQWDVRVESTTGDPGPHGDWVIGAIAGSTLAQLQLLSEGQAARVATQDAAEQVAEDRLVVAEDKAAVALDRQAAQTAKTQAETARQLAQDAAAAAATFDPATYQAADAALDARLDAVEGALPGKASAVAVADHATRLSALEQKPSGGSPGGPILML